MHYFWSTLYVHICLYWIFIKGKKEECLHLRNSAPVVPQTWYHICVGIDTISGLFRIVDNGVLVINEKKELLKNTSSIKPDNFRGKLLGK